MPFSALQEAPRKNRSKTYFSTQWVEPVELLEILFTDMLVRRPAVTVSPTKTFANQQRSQKEIQRDEFSLTKSFLRNLCQIPIRPSLKESLLSHFLETQKMHWITVDQQTALMFSSRVGSLPVQLGFMERVKLLVCLLFCIWSFHKHHQNLIRNNGIQHSHHRPSNLAFPIYNWDPTCNFELYLEETSTFHQGKKVARFQDRLICEKVCSHRNGTEHGFHRHYILTYPCDIKAPNSKVSLAHWQRSM